MGQGGASVNEFFTMNPNLKYKKRIFFFWGGGGGGGEGYTKYWDTYRITKVVLNC